MGEFIPVREDTIPGWQSYRFHVGAVIPVNDHLDMLSMSMQPMFLTRPVMKPQYKGPPPIGVWFDVANYSAVILALSLILWTVHLITR